MKMKHNQPDVSRETGKKKIITSRKVIVTALLLSVIASVILGAALFNMFVQKVVRNLAVQSQSLSDSMNRAALVSDQGSDLIAASSVETLSYVSYYRDHAAKENSELLAYAGNQFPDETFFMEEPDGRILLSEYSDRSLMDRLLEKCSLRDLKEMIPSAVGNRITIDDINVYFRELSDGSILFMADDQMADRIFASFLSPEQVIRSVGSSGNEENQIRAYAVDKDGNVLTKDSSFSLEESGPWYEAITPMRPVSVNQISAEFCLAKIDGAAYLMIHNHNESDRYEIYLCSIPWSDILSQMMISLVIYSFFSFAMITLGLFVFYIRQAALQDPGSPDLAPEVVHRKISVALIVACLGISLISYYTQTLCCLSANVMDDEKILENLKEDILDSQKNDEKHKRDYLTKDENNARVLAEFFAGDSSLVNKETLEDIRRIFGLLYAAVYDKDANALITTDGVRNLAFPEDIEDPFYSLNDIRYSGVTVLAGPAKNIYADGASTVRIVSVMMGADNETIGYLETALDDTVLNLIDNSYSLGNVLSFSVAGEALDFVAVDPETKLVIYSPFSDRQDEDAIRFGLSEESFVTPYFGVHTLNGQRCYARGELINNTLIYLIHSYSTVYLGRGLYVLFVLILFIVMASILMYRMRIERKDGREVIYVSDMEELISADLLEKSSRKEEKVQKETDKLFGFIRSLIFGSTSEWLRKTTHDKIASILGFMLFLIGIIYISIFLTGTSGGGNYYFRSLSYLKTLRGLNIFALNASIEIIAETAVVVTFLRWVLRKLGEIGDQRVETITRLLRSALKYIAVIYSICMCLINFGFNPEELAASAGIIGVAIGIGARDLITDIIAGLFIVFERDVQVGDVVDVAGYQGRIGQIGMRTTKILSLYGDEKLINNRNMTNIVNLSARNSFSTVIFMVPAAVNIDDLEKIFAEEFAGMKNRHRELISDPVFRGVRTLNHGLECEVTAEVPELSRGKMSRVLTKEIKGILDRHNIPIV